MLNPVHWNPQAECWKITFSIHTSWQTLPSAINNPISIVFVHSVFSSGDVYKLHTFLRPPCIVYFHPHFQLTMPKIKTVKTTSSAPTLTVAPRWPALLSRTKNELVANDTSIHYTVIQCTVIRRTANKRYNILILCLQLTLSVISCLITVISVVMYHEKN